MLRDTETWNFPVLGRRRMRFSDGMGWVGLEGMTETAQLGMVLCSLCYLFCCGTEVHMCECDLGGLVS